MTTIQCPPKRTVKFYGPLAKALKRRSFSAVGLNSASEVMRCLLSNFPQLGSHMRERHYRVVMNGRAISKDELDDPVGDNHEIHIIPAICGAGGGPLTSILTGVALIGAGLLLPFAAPFLTPLGIGLALQGVAQLISPTPNDTAESTDPSDRSYNFSGIQQTSREGVPVPLVYGDIVTGSVVLSVGIQADDEELGEGAGVIDGTGGANSAADEANALFVSGSGNPNPDPNPVPDEDLDIDPADYPGGWIWYIFLGSEVTSIYGSEFSISENRPDRRIPYLAYGEPYSSTRKQEGNWIANRSVDIGDTAGAGIVFLTGREWIVDHFNNQIGDIQYVHNFYIVSNSNGPFELSGYFELYKTASDYANRTNAVIWRGN